MKWAADRLIDFFREILEYWFGFVIVAVLIFWFDILFEFF